MKEFYEKADENIVNNCKLFIMKYQNSSANYYVFKKALTWYIELSQSLIASHKEFDEAIKTKIGKVILLEDGPEKEATVARFNQGEYSLILDKTAHELLGQLEMIEKNNRRKQ